MCSSLAIATASWSLDLAEMLIDVLTYQIHTSYFISAKATLCDPLSLWGPVNACFQSQWH